MTSLLAVDSSVSAASVALFTDGAMVAELVVRAVNHGSVLSQLVRDALSLARIELGAVEAFAVGLGPGSFTGTRIAVSMAKGLALATSRPLSGVGSLRALTAVAPPDARSLVSIADARRGEIYGAAWSREGTDWTASLAPTHATASDFAARVRAVLDLESADAFAVGDAPREAWEALGGVRVVPWTCVPSMARLVGLEVLAGRGVRDDGAMEPAYVRAPDARPWPGA